MQSLVHSLESTGPWAPWIFVGIFLAASFLTIWRLESVSAGGLEGTVLGTLITPYITGFGNLVFAYVLGKNHGDPVRLVENCLVNNITNMTLILGVPAIFWNMGITAAPDGGKRSAKSDKKANVREVNRLSLLLTLLAVLFFSGMTWLLGGDGKINRTDGIVLIGLFLFWQCFHVFDVLKSKVRQKKRFSPMLLVDVLLLGVGAWLIYLSVDWLVAWVDASQHSFINSNNLGWLSGWLMVLPNGVLAIYYAWTRRPEIVYSSQVGDNHICIPLCIGIFAVFQAIALPSIFAFGLTVLIGATLAHFLCIAAFGRLPRLAAILLLVAYGWFLKRGLGH